MPDRSEAFTVVVRPVARLQVSYETADGSLRALSAALDYRRDGDWEAGGDAFVSLPEDEDEDTETETEVEAESGSGDGGFGRRVAVYRDGERQFLDRVANETLGRFVDDSRDRAGSLRAALASGVERLREARDERRAGPSTVPVDQGDGTTQEVLLRDAEATFELFRDRASDWRWRLVGDDGVVATSTGGSSRSEALADIESVKRNAAAARIERAEEEEGDDE